MPRTPDVSPYMDFDRATWRKLRKSFPQVLTAKELDQLRGIGENIDLTEVEEVYLPLSRLIHLQVSARQELSTVIETFLEESRHKVPFIIGIAGSVAVGKSTTARLLQVLLQRWPTHPDVALVTTDGFLYPTAYLREKGLMQRKGYPESYDQRALLKFVSDVKSGVPHVHAPVYSHTLYDRVPHEFITVNQPDILIIEGLNVLQTAPTLVISDLFDFSVYVDARTDDIEQWYIDRFLHLRASATRALGAHFTHYAHLSDRTATDEARTLWQTINLPNLIENILPTRIRASLILSKGADHSVNRIRMRKI